MTPTLLGRKETSAAKDVPREMHTADLDQAHVVPLRCVSRTGSLPEEVLLAPEADFVRAVTDGHLGVLHLPVAADGIAVATLLPGSCAAAWPVTAKCDVPAAKQPPVPHLATAELPTKAGAPLLLRLAPVAPAGRK